MEGLSTLNKRLTAVKTQVRKAVRRELAKQGEIITTAQKAMAPDEDGDLRASIEWRYGDQERIKYASLRAKGGSKRDPGMSVSITAGNNRVRYAHLVEFGTKPHVIKPRSSNQSLSINGNKLAPGQSVQHPGAKAKPFFWPIWRNYRKKSMRAISKAARDAIKQAIRK